MSAIPAKKNYTAEEYLAMERSSLEGKCEFVDGQIFAMVGASREHNLIGVNIASELRTQLKVSVHSPLPFPGNAAILAGISAGETPALPRGSERLQLKDRPCETYANDMRVKAAEAKGYHYPDIVVVCGKPEFEDGHLDTLLNPTVLVEILSSSTEAYDRGGKFAAYRKIQSLHEYLLVSQAEPFIERYVRQGEAWVLTETAGLEGLVNLDSIGCVLAMNEVYYSVFNIP